MNRGYFLVSKELIESEEWPILESALKQHFQEVCRKEVENGLFQFHGYSELFKIKPNEGASQQYELWLTSKDGVHKITHANPI